MSPTAAIEQAFLQLAFAIKLLTYTELGKISKSEFDTEVQIKLEKRNLSFWDGPFHSYDDIILGAQNNFVLTLGFTAIVLHDVLTQAGFPNDLPVSSPHRDLRALVYMIRCAFAHDMMNPQWEARGPFARELRLELPSGPLLVDMRGRNGQPFDDSHVGGIETYFEIKAEVEGLISKGTLGVRLEY